MSTLKIENLHVSVGEKEILKGINLTINTGETHAIMGPNGSRRPSGLRKAIQLCNSLAHKKTWLRPG